ncbi:MAG: hypothetical protein JNM25_11560 [Planctomycetes bacterium]|nr:hypothetical protein [Planctomycetota bacterium]
MPSVPAQSFPHAWSRAKPALHVGIGLVGTGLGTMATGRLQTVGWVTVVSGVGILLALLLPLLLRVPVIALDDRGLRARLPGFGIVPWADIERVRLVNIGKRSLLVVDRTPEARRKRPGGRWPRQLAQLAKGKDLAAPLEGLTATPQQIVAVVQLAHRHATGT